VQTASSIHAAACLGSPRRVRSAKGRAVGRNQMKFAGDVSALSFLSPEEMSTEFVEFFFTFNFAIRLE
jgi:hypothetical protein